MERMQTVSSAENRIDMALFESRNGDISRECLKLISENLSEIRSLGNKARARMRELEVWRNELTRMLKEHEAQSERGNV